MSVLIAHFITFIIGIITQHTCLNHTCEDVRIMQFYVALVVVENFVNLMFKYKLKAS